MPNTPKSFDVLVTRDVTESALLRIHEARDEAEALRIAAASMRDEADGLAWSRDDCDGGEPYIADGSAVFPVDASEPGCVASDPAGDLWRAASALLDAFGGNTPDWLQTEARDLAEALEASRLD